MKRIKQLALFLFLSILGHVHAQNISTGITDAGAPLPIGATDPNWRITAGPTGPGNAINFAGIPFTWQSAPVAGSNASWINGTGTSCLNIPGNYTFERSFTISNSTTSFTALLRAAYDDILISLELVDPNGTSIPLTVTPTTIYQLSLPVTHTESTPLPGTWRIRAVLNIVNQGQTSCGAFMLEGEISTDCNINCNCNLLKPSFDKLINLCEGVFTSTSDIPPCIKEAGTESYEWTIDGNYAGSGSSLNYTFPSNGTYQVCLKISGTLPDGSTCEKKYCEDILINGCTGCSCDEVIPNIDYNVDKCSGFFNGTVSLPPCMEGSLVSYTWTINSVYAGSGPSMNYPFTSNGIYTVCLSATVILPDGTKCTKETCTQIIVNNCGECRCKDVIPDFNVTIDNCVATFVNTTTGPECVQRTYKWYVDSVLVGTGNTFTYTFPASGTYTVCMKVVGIMPGGVPCKPVICKEVTVDCNPCNCDLLKPSFEMIVNQCNGTFSTKTLIPECMGASGQETYDWTVDGNYAGSGNTMNYTFPSNGTYAICMTITAFLPNGTTCTKQLCQNVAVTNCVGCCDMIQPNITYNVDKCSAIFNGSAILPECIGGATVSYNWTINSSNAGSGATLIHPFPGNGIYTVCLSAEVILADGTKCVKDTCIQVVVNNCGDCRCKDVLPDFNFTVANCVGTFTNTTAGPDCVQRTYKWYVDSVLVGTGNTFSYAFPGSGTYTVCMKVVGTMPGGVPCKPGICKEITVNCGPCNCYELNSDFTTSFNMCNGTFVNNSQVPSCLSNVSYEWTVDGIVSGSGTTLNYAFSTFGPHNVCLKVTGTMPDGMPCIREACYEVYPPELCPDPCATCSNIQPAFDVATTFCSGTFDGTASSVPACLQNLVYHWYVGTTGSGTVSPVGTGPILNHLFGASGSYTVCLMITGNLPDGTYCERIVCQEVPVTCLIATPAKGATDESPAEESVKLYPNPASDQLTIEMELEESGEVLFILRSSDGKEILTEKRNAEAGLQRFEIKIPESVVNSTLFIEINKGTEKVIRMITILK